MLPNDIVGFAGAWVALLLEFGTEVEKAFWLPLL